MKVEVFAWKVNHSEDLVVITRHRDLSLVQDEVAQHFAEVEVENVEYVGRATLWIEEPLRPEDWRASV